MAMGILAKTLGGGRDNGNNGNSETNSGINAGNGTVIDDGAGNDNPSVTKSPAASGEAASDEWHGCDWNKWSSFCDFPMW